MIYFISKYKIYSQSCTQKKINRFKYFKFFKSRFSGGSVSKGSTCNAGDLSSIPGLGRSPGEGNGYPLQYSCLENSMERGAWWGYSPWPVRDTQSMGSQRLDTTEWLSTHRHLPARSWLQGKCVFSITQDHHWHFLSISLGHTAPFDTGNLPKLSNSSMMVKLKGKRLSLPPPPPPTEGLS